MRWLSRRRHPPPLAEPIERIDPATLEVVELDVAGALHGPPADRSVALRPREIAYAPRDRDPTSLAGVWEALAGS
jgi:hypothetical protein